MIYFPFKNLEDQPMKVDCGLAHPDNAMLRYMKKYTAVEGFNLFCIQDTTQVNINPNATVTVAQAYAAQTFRTTCSSINCMAKAQPVVVVVFGNPDQVRQFPQASAIVASHRPGWHGRIGYRCLWCAYVSRSLPIACGEFLPATGIRTTWLIVFILHLPEAAGMDSESPAEDKVNYAGSVDIGGAPGCQVIVARHGRIFDRTLGWLSYDNQVPVRPMKRSLTCILTKVSATLQATMFLYDKGNDRSQMEGVGVFTRITNTNKKTSP